MDLNLTILGEFILQDIKKINGAPGTTYRPSLLGNADAPTAPSSSVFETLEEQKSPSRAPSKVAKKTSPSKLVWVLLITASLVTGGIFMKSTFKGTNDSHKESSLRATPTIERTTNNQVNASLEEKSNRAQAKDQSSPELANVSSTPIKETAIIVDQGAEEPSTKKGETYTIASLASQKNTADDKGRVATIANENSSTSTPKKKSENTQSAQEKTSAEKNTPTQKIAKATKPSKSNQEPVVDRDVVILSALVASDTTRTSTEPSTQKTKKPSSFEQKLKLENQWYGLPERKNQDPNNPSSECKNASGEMEKCPAP